MIQKTEAQNDLNEIKEVEEQLIEMIWYKNRVNRNIVLEMFQQ